MPRPATWPTVVRTPVRAHVSVLTPQLMVGTGLCSPSHVDAIQQPDRVPVVGTLRARLRPWEGEPPRLSGAPPSPVGSPPVAPTHDPEPVEPRSSDFVPPSKSNSLVSRLQRAFASVQAVPRFTEAHTRWREDKEAWDAGASQRDRERATYESALARWRAEQDQHAAQRMQLERGFSEASDLHARERDAHNAAVEADEIALERLTRGALANDPVELPKFAAQLWRGIPLPADFPREVEVAYEPGEGILLYTIAAPDFERVPLSTSLKTGTRKPVGDRTRRATQQRIIHVLALRLAHEVFAAAELATVQLVGVNVRLHHTDRQSGQPRDLIVGSLSATRDEMRGINLSEVDPKLCFRALRGVESPSFEQVSAVQPLLSFNRDDRRIVQGREVLDHLDSSTNLAAMDWEDFEHVVRQLFQKMFSARSPDAEVHVTRASRDYGVDALVYDPDPIMGGKFVIQAKRYINTVDVAAVRDLYGTVQNEGASKGFLVTTSSFGPDAHRFAKDKPLTLIDGPQLLSLLRQHGYAFRIDLAEARRVLHGR